MKRINAKPLAWRMPRKIKRHAIWVGDCLLWKGNPDKRGRMVRDDGTFAYIYALVWEETNGPIPAGKQINHRCNVPGCIRLDHLYMGTEKDNSRDRHQAGTAWYQSLTAEERSAEIKRRWETRRGNSNA